MTLQPFAGTCVSHCSVRLSISSKHTDQLLNNSRPNASTSASDEGVQAFDAEIRHVWNASIFSRAIRKIVRAEDVGVKYVRIEEYQAQVRHDIGPEWGRDAR